MRAYEATADIVAGPEAIWEVLTDGASYPAWDSGVLRVEGDIAAGQKIKVFTELSPSRAFPVSVSEFDAPRRMAWRGGMPLGLFKGVRTFVLTPVGDGRTRLTTREEFSGPLLPLIGRSIPDLQPSFDQFVAGVKSRAEASSAS